MHKTLIALCLTVTLNASAQQRHSDTADDVLQYVPYASVFALKAAGVESSHQWTQFVATAAASWVASAGTAYVLKHSIHEWRPDSTDRRSFPSGHSTIAFAGATALRHEFGHLSPWITVGGYTVATLTAIDRVCRDRHHWYDVCAGAAIGVAATELTYYVSDLLFPPKQKNFSLGITPAGLDLVVRW